LAFTWVPVLGPSRGFYHRPGSAATAGRGHHLDAPTARLLEGILQGVDYP